MSRAIMKAMIEAEQDRVDAILEQLPEEQQRAILGSESAICYTFDDDDPFAPLPAKPKRSLKNYMFRRSMYALNPAILCIGKPTGGEAVHYLTNATYNRFAELANSGAYPVTIEPADYGVCWSIRRPL